MYRRLIVLAGVLFAGLAVFCGMGLRAIDMHAQGLEAKRAGEFVEVAEQVRLDVKRKLDAFLQAEQARPFEDYQRFYVPRDNVYMNEALLISPLAEQVRNGLAYGYFQVNADGRVTSPHVNPAAAAPAEITQYLQQVEAGLPSVLGRRPDTLDRQVAAETPIVQAPQGKGALRRDTYKIELKESQQPAQVITQNRAQVESNFVANSAPQQQALGVTGMDMMGGPGDSLNVQRFEDFESSRQAETPGVQPPLLPQAAPTATVQVRIEPFVPIRAAAAGEAALFDGQVFLLRHVQIEQNHFLQGFRLDQEELTSQIRESAGRLVRGGMGFEIGLSESAAAAHTAILDFGFGDLVLNLFESDPGRLGSQIRRLRQTYFAITAIVTAAVTAALAGLGRSLRAQARLARKKDDFISAVSHELRTPLTSIRMYTEMLENDWVKTEDKRRQYYAGMRQESERLSRLIENVLDFSRIQRKRKRYRFQMGDLNRCAEQAVAMFLPCARQAGFEIRTEWAELPEAAFDRDAVTQIVINLLDNAVKYAADGEKVIFVRTVRRKDCVVLEVEDRGPGIPRHLQKKVFEEFYRCSDESTREAPGTGLGLALVRKFAEAHQGFVTVAGARPRGAVFRVGFGLSAAGVD